jgi:hypothetical protein
MIGHRHRQFWHAAMLLAAMCVCGPALLLAQAPKPDDPSSATKITPQTRINVIKSLQSERVFARVLFPQGDKGLKIKNGVVSPTDMVIAQQVAEFGAAAKPGDRCVITDIRITDKAIVLDINGGGKKKGKWYQHIQISGAGGASSQLPGTPSPQSLDAHGSSVTLEFDKFVPEVNGDGVRALLAPVFDFKALTAAEAYEKTLPPKVQEAIRDHKVLVGMDKEMVTFSKGRPQQRIRDKDDKGEDYEEWIYGKPPEEVDFIRFRGNEVARLEIMTVDGKKEIRTEREVDLPSKEAELADQKAAPKPAQKPPSLRLPGEEPESAGSSAGTPTLHRIPQQQAPGNPNDGTPNDGSPNPSTTGTTPPGTPPINPNGTAAPHLAPAS